tara:strand:+ start:474 stop:692 length:219 start_codon:yes stop_codon:yes gene_type:complete
MGSKYICSECGGDHIGWDAWADENGEIISVMDHNECLECESTGSAIKRLSLEVEEETYQESYGQHRTHGGTI